MTIFKREVISYDAVLVDKVPLAPEIGPFVGLIYLRSRFDIKCFHHSSIVLEINHLCEMMQRSCCLFTVDDLP